MILIYLKKNMIKIINTFEKKYPYLKAVSIHPGMISTKILSFPFILIKIILSTILYPLFYLISRSRIQDAQTQLFCCYSNN